MKAHQSTRRIAGGAATAMAAAGLAYLTYVVLSYRRYGRATTDGGVGRDTSPLDAFLPTPEVADRHEVRVAAPASATFAAARAMGLDRSRLVRAVFRGREILMRAGERRTTRPRSLLDETLAIGWGILAEDPGRVIVVGALARPWEGNPDFHPLPPREFAAFHEPGWAKIAWTLEAIPREDGSSVFRTETRVVTTDPASRERFRRYWAALSPGIRLIRRESLRLVTREAERRERV